MLCDPEVVRPKDVGTTGDLPVISGGALPGAGDVNDGTLVGVAGTVGFDGEGDECSVCSGSDGLFEGGDDGSLVMSAGAPIVAIGDVL